VAIGGTGNGLVPIIITQLPNSPDLNINNLCFFYSFKVDVKRICTHYPEMVVNVMKAFEEYHREKIDDLWACWFNNLRIVTACDSGNEYKPAHSACDLTVNLEHYDRCVRLYAYVQLG
jgi:hypothetical protein